MLERVAYVALCLAAPIAWGWAANAIFWRFTARRRRAAAQKNLPDSDPAGEDAAIP